MYGRISGHLKILGMIEVIYGLLHVLVFIGLGAMSLLGCSICSASESTMDGLAVGATWSVIWAVIGIVGGITFLIPVLAGLALANGRGWAKIATIIFAIIMIAEFPLGTAFAIYAFWAIVFDKDS